jgi:hypothetical protein
MTPQSQVVEYSSISDVLQHLTAPLSHTVLVFDIDNTLIKPQGWIGGSSWFEHLLHEKVAVGMAQQEAYTSVVELCTQLQPYLTWLPVEQETVATVQQFQKSGAQVLAMTGRGPEQAEITVRQLQSIGLSFVHSCPSITLIDSWYTIQEGVVFSSFYEKGKVLVDFLSKVTAPISTVICIDDMLRNIQSIERALIKHRSDLAFIGVQYTHLNDEVAAFNPAEADEEFKATMAKISI